jgi:hypothetical protein
LDLLSLFAQAMVKLTMIATIIYFVMTFLI